MTSFVIDASVAVQWVVTEQHTPQALSLFHGHQLHAPAHWLAEASNTVWNKVRRGDVEYASGPERVAILCAAPVWTARLDTLGQAAFDIALMCMVSVYDSLYVALARDLGVQLVTADVKLLSALRTAGIDADAAKWIGDF